MDENFRKHEQIEAEKRRDLYSADFTAELNDSDNGRAKRFGMYDKHQKDKARIKRDKKAYDLAAKISASYAKLYNAVMRDLIEALPIVYEALEAANGKLAELQSRAITLPDGTRIYKNNKDEVVSEDGLILSAAETSKITWNGGEPTWEERQDIKVRRDQLELGFNRLGEIHAIMEDDNIDKTSEMMEGFEKEIEDLKHIALPATVLRQSYNAQKTQVKITDELDMALCGRARSLILVSGNLTLARLVSATR